MNFYIDSYHRFFLTKDVKIAKHIPLLRNGNVIIKVIVGNNFQTLFILDI